MHLPDISAILVLPFDHHQINDMKNQQVYYGIYGKLLQDYYANGNTNRPTVKKGTELPLYENGADENYVMLFDQKEGYGYIVRAPRWMVKLVVEEVRPNFQIGSWLIKKSAEEPNPNQAFKVTDYDYYQGDIVYQGSSGGKKGITQAFEIYLRGASPEEIERAKK